MFGLPSSYNRNNDLLKGKKKKKFFFYRNKQKLITFSSQAKEASSYFVVNNKLRKWVGLWLTQTNWAPFVVLPTLSFSHLSGRAVPTAHRGQGVGRLFHTSSLHLDQKQRKPGLLPAFLLAEDMPCLWERLNIKMDILLRVKASHRVSSWEALLPEPLMGS